MAQRVFICCLAQGVPIPPEVTSPHTRSAPPVGHPPALVGPTLDPGLLPGPASARAFVSLSHCCLCAERSYLGTACTEA